MDNQQQDNDIVGEEGQKQPIAPKGSFPFGSAMIAIAIIMLAGAIAYSKNTSSAPLTQGEDSRVAAQTAAVDPLEEVVIPSGGVFIPVRWGDLGTKMVANGVINRGKFEAAYFDRGGVGDDVRALLDTSDIEKLVITPQNSGQVLNVLWALGLANKNPILEKGPMQDPKYGGAGRFASTGGWTLAEGDAMDHYSKHALIKLTQEQQALVERVSKNIYRPCCGNATYFPDCNHGMAMLGLLELMASQGVSEQNMYRAALQVNAYWFPDTYLTIAKYMKQKGISWDAVNPKEVLGDEFSSSAGYQRIVAEMATPAVQDGTSRPRSSGGCGV